MPSAELDDLLTIEAELALGIAAQLAEWDIAAWSGGIDVEYPDPMPARPIYLGPDEPANTPDERVLLTVKPAMPVRGRITETPVSFNWRGADGGDPLDGLRFTGLLYRRLHRLAHFQFGVVRVGLVRQTSAGTIGRDSRRRPGATANYLVRGLNPTANP